MPSTEEWRVVPGFSRYVISDRGRVVSHMKRKPYELKVRVNKYGYAEVELVDDSGRPKHVQIHRAIAHAWHGEPFQGAVVRHLNGIKLDNRPANLRWGTCHENNVDTVRQGLNAARSKTHCKRGHEFTPENTWAGRVGALGEAGRVCAKCTYARKAERRKRLGRQA